jgi:hypothetical protein
MTKRCSAKPCQTQPWSVQANVGMVPLIPLRLHSAQDWTPALPLRSIDVMKVGAGVRRPWPQSFSSGKRLRAVPYVYFEDEPGRPVGGEFAHTDEARRIAAFSVRFMFWSDMPPTYCYGPKRHHAPTKVSALGPEHRGRPRAQQLRGRP